MFSSHICPDCGFVHTAQACPTSDQVETFFETFPEDGLNQGLRDALELCSPRSLWNFVFAKNSFRPLPGQTSLADSLAAPGPTDQVEGTNQPYTHAAHAIRCREYARQGVVLSRQRVQCLKGGVLYCAELIAPYSPANGPECWFVEADFPERCRFAVACNNTRLCASCACSASAGGAPLGEGPAQALEGVTCM